MKSGTPWSTSAGHVPGSARNWMSWASPGVVSMLRTHTRIVFDRDATVLRNTTRTGPRNGTTAESWLTGIVAVGVGCNGRVDVGRGVVGDGTGPPLPTENLRLTRAMLP